MSRSLRMDGPFRIRFDSPGIGVDVNVAGGAGYVLPGYTFKVGDVIYNAWPNVVTPWVTGDGSSPEVQVYYGRADPNDNLMGGAGATAYAQGLSQSTPGLVGVNLTRKPAIGSITAQVSGSSAAALPRTVAVADQPVIVTIASTSGAGGQPLTAGESDIFFLVSPFAPYVATGVFVDAAAVLAYVGVKSPAASDTDWAAACAAAVESGINTRLNGAVVTEPSAAWDEISLAATYAAGEAYKRREAPFSSAGFADSEAITLARDYLDQVKPQIDRYSNGPGIG